MAKAVTICQSRDTAKKHGHDIDTTELSGVAGIATMHRIKQPQQQMAGPVCQGYGYPPHQEGHRQCPAYYQVCMSHSKVRHFAKVCHSKHPVHLPIAHTTDAARRHTAKCCAAQARAKALHVSHDQHQLQLYTMQEAITKPAPTVTADLSSTMIHVAGSVLLYVVCINSNHTQ